VCTVVAWRASRIADPVERLRFLRRWLGDQRAWTISPAAESRSFWQRQRLAVLSIAALFILPGSSALNSGRLWTQPPAPAPAAPAVEVAAPWVVESAADHETWSNGLRVERAWEVEGQPRSYAAIDLTKEGFPLTEVSDAPVGLVFHTTESHLAPLEEAGSSKLLSAGAVALAYVREKRGYHYVIDRFGRAWRVVREADAANHAGNSVWAARGRAWLQLNHAFLGLAVEGRSVRGEEAPFITPAQTHTLRLLVEALRGRYRIAAENCITHAQVSVNPANDRIGYHTDWGAGFPYAAVGLPDNYALPLAGLAVFGFQYNPALLEQTGAAYWRGIAAAENAVRQAAAAQGTTAAAYRRLLAERYHLLLRDSQRPRPPQALEKSE
jgi:hypothetical protein